MLMGGWDGQCWCSAGCCMAAGRLEPSLRISVLTPWVLGGVGVIAVLFVLVRGKMPREIHFFSS